MIYFLYISYIPSTAPCNRALSYLRSLDKMAIHAKVLFFLPDKNRSKIPDNFKYISIKYYWDKFFINHNVLKYISYYFYLKCFVNTLKKGDVVYIYGNEDILLNVLKAKGVRVYFEITECPEASMSGSRLYTPTLENHYALCKKVDGLIVISQALKNYYTKHGIEEDKIHVVNMTVDVNRFHNLYKTENAEPYIAYCGNVSNSKDGVDVLIKSFSIVVKKHPDIKLYIIGKKTQNLNEDKNVLLIKKLKLESKVVFTGVVTAEQMPQLLKNAKILALARPDNIQAKYGFPTKLGEYLLTGNPVVVTSVGDIPLYLKDMESALLSEPNNYEGFANKCIWAIEHPNESLQIGESGCEIAKKHFNSETETKKLMNIIYNI